MKRKVHLKVCGMREVDNIIEAGKVKPDYMGFIFYAGSPRFVGGGFQLPEAFPLEVKRVGVFVNERTEVMLEYARRLRLDYLQLHGHETVQQCDELKKNNIKIIKVFSVDNETNFNVTKPYRDVVDYFLFDTKGKYYGGNAKAFDWSILARYDQEVPFFLSGGVSPENLSGLQALKEMNIHAVDVNSGVEVRPGLKDIDKLRELVAILEQLR